MHSKSHYLVVARMLGQTQRWVDWLLRRTKTIIDNLVLGLRPLQKSQPCLPFNTHMSFLWNNSSLEPETKKCDWSLRAEAPAWTLQQPFLNSLPLQKYKAERGNLVEPHCKEQKSESQICLQDSDKELGFVFKQSKNGNKSKASA